MGMFSLCPLRSTVQSHKICREPAGDDQLSHGMLSLPCETFSVYIYCCEGQQQTDRQITVI